MQSDIFNRMIDFLPPVFNKEPPLEFAFEINHISGQCRVTVSNNRFQAKSNDTNLFSIDIDLTDKSISDVVNVINSSGGYIATLYGDGTLNAIRLADIKNSPDSRIYSFSGVNWSLFKALSMELSVVEETLQEAMRQMTIVGATSYVQDYWGSYADVTRRYSDTDPYYGFRVLMAFKQPKSNNVALELIIKGLLGLNTQVNDLGWDTEGLMLMNFEPTPINWSCLGMWKPRPFYVFPHNWISQWYMYMNDPETPINDFFYPLWGPPGYYPWESATFAVMLQDKAYANLTQGQIDDLRDIVNQYKAAGTAWRLYWKEDAHIMLMNKENHPVNDGYYVWPIKDGMGTRFDWTPDLEELDIYYNINLNE